MGFGTHDVKEPLDFLKVSIKVNARAKWNMVPHSGPDNAVVGCV